MCCFGHGSEMGHCFAWVGLVYHGWQDHQAIHAGFLGVGGEATSQSSAALGHAGEHGNSAGNLLDRRPQHVQFFRILQGTVFTDRP